MNASLTCALRATVAGLAFSAIAASPAAAQDTAHSRDQKLSVAFDVGFAPFVFLQGSGEMTGFSYDFASALAERLGRPGLEGVDTNYSAIFAGLFSGRYEMIAAPTNITEERASQMLFSEPYMPTGIGFLVRTGEALDGPEGLDGKIVTVNNGSVSDKWASENAEKYGFTVQRYNKNADAVQAVMIGRAFVNLADAPVSRYIATQTPNTEVAYVLDTGNNFGLAFRKDDAAFRAKVDEAIECMKMDGSLAEIHVKWFGTEPDAESSTATPFPGYGAPGFEGYDESEHEPNCS